MIRKTILAGKTALFGAGLLLTLEGCVATDTLSFRSKPSVTTTVFKKSANIIIGGPTGFCVNSRQSRTNANGAFVVFGPCLSDNSPSSGPKGLFFANVSANDAQSLDASALATFFKSAEGLKTLSNTDEAKTVDILDTNIKHGIFFIHTRDSSDPLIPDTTNESWRGFFVVSGRLVSVSMVNFIENPTPQSVVFNRLEDFATRIIQLNKSNS